ncbi:hypothetical protein EC845_1954 [Comamonas sp. BIGb0124]|uniref:hypothetical protein n=1 Tax=Comamonas sp. BIGb0124 TaxID=2485130 RepID=UPI000F4A6BE1|nr:hypothetical protein [Comamonas sp. BIGb0124]ROR23040.1 hypothetical protein EC845_1954 [Comamonas sp. BIGb0124]
MTNPLNGKVANFGKSVDVLEQFMTAPAGDVELPDGSAIPNLRKLNEDMRESGAVGQVMAAARIAENAAITVTDEINPQNSKAEGLTNTPEGGIFTILPGGVDNLTRTTKFRKNNGLAVKVTDTASGSEHDDLSSTTAGVASVFDSPNLFTDTDFTKMAEGAANGTDPEGYFFKTTSALLDKATTADGRPALRLRKTAASPNTLYTWSQALTALEFAAASKFSVSLLLEPGSIVAGNTYVFLKQLDNTGAEIPTTGVTVQVPAGILTAKLPIRFAGQTVHADARRIQVSMSSTSAALDVMHSSVLVAAGTNANFRPASAKAIDKRASVVAAAAVVPETRARQRLRNRTAGLSEVFDQPSVFIDRDYAKTVAAAGSDSNGDIYTKTSTAVLAVATNPDGRPAYRLTRIAGTPEAVQYWRFSFNRLGVAVGEKFSAHVRIDGLVENSACRVMLVQRTAAGSELIDARVAITLPNGALESEPVNFAGVTRYPDMATVEVYVGIGAQGPNSALTVSEHTAAAGTVADYRPSTEKAFSAKLADWRAAGSVVGKTEVGNTLAALVEQPNLVNNAWIETVGQGVGSARRETVTVDGQQRVRVYYSTGEWALIYPRSKFPSGKIAMCGTLAARSAVANGRVLVMQRDAAGVEVPNTRVTMTFGSPLVLPTAFDAVTDLHPNCANVYLYPSANTGAVAEDWAEYVHVLLSDGANAAYRPSLATASAQAATVAEVAYTGNDSTGNGTVAAPYRTLNRALEAIYGNGRINIAHSLLYGSEMRVTPGKVKGHVSIYGEWKDGAYPLIRMAAPITGWTKTPGRTKIYQAQVAGLPSLEDFNWAYQDGVNDPRYPIANEHRQPEHRGRTHVLVGMTMLVKPTAYLVLANALTEMDAAAGDNPMATVDPVAGTIYVTCVGGVAPTESNIYLDATVGLVSAATMRSAGTIEVFGLEVRYGGVDLRPFRHAHVDELIVKGARNNGVDYSSLSFGCLEIGAAGSRSGSVGDGLNGHARSIAYGRILYTYLVRDDGWSGHENDATHIMGGLAEYNGGTALCPSYGCNAIIENYRSFRNQRRGAQHKAFAFYVHFDPAASDYGVATVGLFKNCTSIEDVASFGDNSPNRKSFLTAMECKSIRPSAVAFDCYKIMDCTQVGAPLAKTMKVAVHNSQVVM